MATKTKTTKSNKAQPKSEKAKAWNADAPLTEKGHRSTAGAAEAGLRDYRRVFIARGRVSEKGKSGAKLMRVVDGSAAKAEDGAVTLSYINGQGKESKPVTIPRGQVSKSTLYW